MYHNHKKYRKMFKWTWMLFPWFVIATPLMAQPSTDSGQSIAGLKDIIRLQEHTENGKPLGLVFGTIPQDVDINSVIGINVSSEQILQNYYYKSKSPLRPEQRALLEAANRLQVGADILIEGLRQAAELNSAGRGEIEFTNKATEVQNYFTRSVTLLDSYLTFVSQQNTGELGKRKKYIRDKFIKASEGELEWAPVIAAEIRWIIQELEKTGQEIIREADPVALNLVAYQVSADQKTFIHLEHYDILEPGVPQSVDKLNVVPSPEQAAKLKEAYTKTKEVADKLNEIEDRREQLKESLNVILKQHGIDLAELKDAAKALQQELDNLLTFDWKAQLEVMQNRISVALTASPANAQKQKLQTISDRLKNIKTQLVLLENKVANIKKLITEFSPRLDMAAIKNRDDPVDALLALMGQISQTQNAFTSIVQAINTLRTDAQAFAENTSDVSKELDGLLDAINAKEIGAPMQTELKQIIRDTFQPAITPVKDAAQRLQAVVTKVVASINAINEEAQNKLNLYAATAITPPDTTSLVPLMHAKNTWLDLREVKDRKDNSIVVFQASLYEFKKDNEKIIPSKLIDTETQTLRILRYGFYGEYSVGLAYVFAENVIANQTVQHRGFAPQVSWVLRHRGWRNTNEPAHYVKKWYEYLGVGIHTVALDSNNDNQTEIGLGVTVSIAEGMFQLGYGKNLSTDRTYSFIATRLFNF